ncbi:hypothetical protein [Kribbella sp. NPDC048928]|uniref:hypothetical protein n=1 Tax=Kribbella sp. NPDC048928 TaxID=3364111 RepID=UPI003714AA46
MGTYGRWPLRLAGYLVVTLVAAYVVTSIGVGYYDARECPHPDLDADCDAALGGLVWGAAAVGVCVVLVVTIESILWSKRINRRAELEGR